jgi:hypothetical protein
VTKELLDFPSAMRSLSFRTGPYNQRPTSSSVKIGGEFMKILGIGELEEFFMLLKEHTEAIKQLSLTTVCDEEVLHTIYRHARDMMELIKEYEEKMGYVKEYEEV